MRDHILEHDSEIKRKKHLKSLYIQNFKSLENVQLDLKRVNIFLGEPNVGKSNILEVVGLLSAIGHGGSIRDFIRLETYDDLFFKGFLDRNIRIQYELEKVNDKNNIQEIERRFEIEYRGDVFNINEIHQNQKDQSKIKRGIGILMNLGADKTETIDKLNDIEFYKNSKLAFYTSKHKRGQDKIGYTEAFFMQSKGVLDFFKFYKFFDFKVKQMKLEEYTVDDDEDYIRKVNFDIQTDSLLPSGGDNIYDVVKKFEYNQLLLRDILDYFGLKLNINVGSKRVEVIEEDSNSIFKTYPIYSLADTIQSMIFHNLIMSSNKNSVIALEEPEVHTFPFYSRDIGENIAEDDTNQYLISSHNRYFVNSILQKCDADDLQIFIVQKEEGKTIVNPIKEDEIGFLLDGDTFAAVSHYDEWKKTNIEGN